jgi:hypothetical protein
MASSRQGLRALGEAVAALTRPIISQRGFARGALVAEWPAVVGDRLAANTVPERLAYAPKQTSAGTLHLRVASGSLAMELQHLEPVLIDRINGYFGHRAVARIRLIQGPIPASARPGREVKQPRPLSADEEAFLAALLAGVADDALRATLQALGRTVMARTGAADARR